MDYSMAMHVLDNIDQLRKVKPPRVLSHKLFLNDSQQLITRTIFHNQIEVIGVLKGTFAFYDSRMVHYLQQLLLDHWKILLMITGQLVLVHFFYSELFLVARCQEDVPVGALAQLVLYLKILETELLLRRGWFVSLHRSQPL